MIGGAHAGPGRREVPIVLVVVLLAGYLVALGVIPRLRPPDPLLPNVAAASGYHTGVAYVAMAAWTVVAILALAAGRWRRGSGRPEAETGEREGEPPSAVAAPTASSWFECLAVGVLVLPAYWPPFLARYGHYIEDNYFLNVLLRLQCGQEPYRDFEFLYGPLMVVPAGYWMGLFGYSLQSYYTLLAFVQAAFFAVLWRVFQHHVRRPGIRLAAFAVFAPFVLDTLLGLNYTGWRAVLPVFAIMAVAARPADVRTGAGAGALIGIQLAYSYEYGLVGLVAVLLMFAVAWAGRVRETRGAAVLAFVSAAVATGVGVTWALLGSTIGAYVEATRHVLASASRDGLGNLPFHWTLNSLALFGLLALGVVAVGRGLPGFLRAGTSYGDRLLLGALLFAIGSLRFALQRADVWHMTIPFTALLLVFLWRPALRACALGPATARVAVALLVVASVTRLVGILPEGSYVASGLARGARDVVLGASRGAEVISRTRSILTELSAPDPSAVAAAAALAHPDRALRPVLFYGDNWWQGTHLGVCPAGYASYQLAYTEAYRSTVAFLDAHPDALVLIDRRASDELFHRVRDATVEDALSVTKQVGLWLSSVHHAHKVTERDIRSDLWRARVGWYLAQHYQLAFHMGEDVVLERRDPGHSISGAGTGES